MDQANTSSDKSTPVVELSCPISASADTVWDILTDPARFSAWMQGDVTFDTSPGSIIRADFSSYGIKMSGVIRTFDPSARRFVLTWGIESGPQAEEYPAGSTLLSLEVHPEGAGCRLDLRQSGLPSARAAREQEGGWRFQLSRLDLTANRTDLAAGLERTLPEWIAAWNEQDEEKRMAALRRCCAEDVTFRDDWTGLSGIGLLGMHIANCHRYMPGYTLAHTGDLRICRGEALAGWRSTGPGGPAEGFNHIQADPDGTIRRVTGFQQG